MTMTEPENLDRGAFGADLVHREWRTSEPCHGNDARCWNCGQPIEGLRVEVILRGIVVGRVHPECELATVLALLERDQAA